MSSHPPLSASSVSQLDQIIGSALAFDGTVSGEHGVGFAKVRFLQGGGATFSLTHPEMSQTVADVKMRCVAESGARTVATGCPACVMQIRDSLVHRGMPQKAVHTVEIINRSLRAVE